MKGAKSVALGGMLTALSVALLFVSGFTQIANYAIDAAAGVILIIAVVELGKKSGALVYSAVTVLSLLLIPNKEPGIVYGTIFGLYSLLKAVIERINKPVFEWILKVVSANVCFCIAGLLLYAVGIFPEDFAKLILPYILLLNAVFVVYDIALTRLIGLYIYRLRKKKTM